VLFDVATLQAYSRAAEKLQSQNPAFSYRIEKGYP
jgi:hypothetical protein